MKNNIIPDDNENPDSIIKNFGNAEKLENQQDLIGTNKKRKRDCCAFCRKCLLITAIFVITTTLIIIIVNAIKYRNVISHKNIVYGEFERNKMDIYFPKKSENNTNKNYGSMLFIHGGSWTVGDKSGESGNCKDLCLHGYITASINYHYINEDSSVWDDMNDIELAIKKLQSFSLEKGYTINATSIHGYSSGGHLTTLFSYSRPEKSVIPLKFIVDKAGPVDFHSDTWKEWKYNEKTGPSISIMLNGIKNFKEYIDNAEDDIDKIPKEILENAINNVSSVHYINNNSVPTICAYAGEDLVVPTKNKKLIVNKLNETGVAFEFFEFKNSNHMLISDPDTHKQFEKKILEYCKFYFGY